MTPSAPITVHVRMNARILRRFAMYDTFRVQRRWRAPALFAAILLFFAGICHLLTDKAQSAMIGNVLLVIGVGLPLAYVLHFLLQVHDQSRRLGLKTLRPAYTLNMEDNRLRVLNDMRKEPELSLAWDALHGVYRAEFAFYLYATPSRAFLIPDGQYDGSPAAMYDFLKSRLPDGKMHGKRP